MGRIQMEMLTKMPDNFFDSNLDLLANFGNQKFICIFSSETGKVYCGVFGKWFNILLEIIAN